MIWMKIKAFLKKNSIAIIAALSALLAVIIGILVTTGNDNKGTVKEQLIKRQKENVDKTIKIIEKRDKELKKEDELIVKEIKAIKKESEESEKEVIKNVKEINNADSFDELLAIQRDLCKRVRNK